MGSGTVLSQMGGWAVNTQPHIMSTSGIFPLNSETMQLNFEPTLLAVMATDFMVILLILSASWTAYRVLLHWEPESAGRTQLYLEIASDTSSIKVMAAAVAFFFSTILLIAAIANVLPAIVPGAMCGTGVIQATDGMGNRAIVFRLVAMFLLFLRCELEKVDRTIPDSSLVQTNAGLLLIALPVVFLSMTATFQAISGLNVQQPVDCCAAVYDAVRSPGDISVAVNIPHVYWVISFLTGAVFLLVLGLRMWLTSSPRSVHEAALLVVIALCWVVVSWVTLLNVLSAYHYQVLNHHCPWCLFLSEHRLVGYPLFGALALTAFEGTMVFAATRIGNKYPRLQSASLSRIKKAGIRLVSTVMLFLIISGVPAVLWRLKYGVWISG